MASFQQPFKHMWSFFGSHPAVFQHPSGKQPRSFGKKTGQWDATALSHHRSIQATVLRKVKPLMVYTAALKTDNTPNPWKMMVGKLSFFFGWVGGKGYDLVWLRTVVFFLQVPGQDMSLYLVPCKKACFQDTFVFLKSLFQIHFPRGKISYLETRCTSVQYQLEFANPSPVLSTQGIQSISSLAGQCCSLMVQKSEAVESWRPFRWFHRVENCF